VLTGESVEVEVSVVLPFANATVFAGIAVYSEIAALDSCCITRSVRLIMKSTGWADGGCAGRGSGGHGKTHQLSIG